MRLKKLIFLSFLFLSFFSIAQENQQYGPEYYAQLYRNNSNPDSLAKSYKFFESRKEQSIEANYYMEVVYCLLHLSSIEDRFGQYFESEKSAVLGIHYLDSVPPSPNKTFYQNYLNNRLGNVMERYGKYDKSIAYYSKAMEYTFGESNMTIAYNNVGSALMEQRKFVQAKDTLQKAFEIVQTLNDPFKYSMILNNLGYAELMLGEKDGLKKMNEAIKIRKKQNDPALYDSYRRLIDYYSEINSSSQVVFYAKKSFDLAREMKNLQYKKEALSVLMELGLNEYGREYYKTMQEYLDVNNLLRNTFTEAKYSLDVEKKKTEEEKSKRIVAESERIKSEFESQRNLFIALVIFLISVSLFLVIRNRHRRNIVVKQFETEQRISKRLHDEVANDVFHIMSKIQSNKVDQDDLVDDLEGIYDKTRDLSNANSDLDVFEDFVLQLNDLLHSYKNVNVNIFTRNIFLIDWENIANDKKKVLYRILQELMTNMKKHSDASLVTLIFQQEKKKVHIDYKDNGVGCEVYKGNGLRNAENRIELIGGKITFESEPGNGFKAKIRI